MTATDLAQIESVVRRVLMESLGMTAPLASPITTSQAVERMEAEVQAKLAKRAEKLAKRAAIGGR